MLFDFFWVRGIVGNRGESWGILFILFLIVFQIFRVHVVSLVLLLLYLLVLFNYNIPGRGFMCVFLPRESLRCHGVAVRGRRGNQPGERRFEVTSSSRERTGGKGTPGGAVSCPPGVRFSQYVFPLKTNDNINNYSFSRSCCSL